VRRLVLLVILGLCVWYYFPETRALLTDAAAPVLVPVMKWGAAAEMEQLARNVVEHERLTGVMPGGPEWLGWLEYRYPNEGLRLDPWGSTYQLEVTRDWIEVVSLGPDRIRATGDDFSVRASRER